MDGGDREFFTKVKDAAFANPFGEERELVDLEISGLDASRSNEEILAKLSSDVLHRINTYRDQAVGMGRGDRDLYRYAVLFYIFHEYCDHYDRLIAEQMKAGDEPVKVGFAKEILNRLGDYGFSSKDGLKFLAFSSSSEEAFILSAQSPAGADRSGPAGGALEQHLHL